jgi:hypothetical protein
MPGLAEELVYSHAATAGRGDLASNGAIRIHAAAQVASSSSHMILSADDRG